MDEQIKRQVEEATWRCVMEDHPVTLVVSRGGKLVAVVGWLDGYPKHSA